MSNLERQTNGTNRTTCLFVSIHKQQGIFQLLLLKDCMKFFSRSPNSVSITTVYHINYSLCVGVITSPVRTYTGLTPKVPNLKFDVLVCDRLHIKTYRCITTGASFYGLRMTICTDVHAKFLLGIVETTSPTCSLSESACSKILSHHSKIAASRAEKAAKSLHRIVVLPALSSPSTKILASFSPNRATSLDIHRPILVLSSRLCRSQAHWQGGKVLPRDVR